MKYILLLITAFSHILFEYVYTLGNISYNSFKRVNKYIDWYGKNIIGWQTLTNITTETTKNVPDKLVVISNHINFIDAVIIPKMLVDTFPEHKLMFITRDKYGKLPLAGKYFRDNHILIKNNLDEDIQLINNKITEFTKLNPKIMILIFPEGTFMNHNTIKASNNWCSKIGIRSYNRCLAPRTSGIFSILNIIKPSVILATSIIYTDNLQNNKGTEFHHLLYDYFPKFSCISAKLVNTANFNLENRAEFDTAYYNYWRKEYDNSVLV